MRLPASACSAACARHGTGATAPITTRADLIEKIITAAMSVQPNRGGTYPLYNALKALMPELEKSAPAAKAADLPLVQAMPDRGGQAARFRSEHMEDRLCLDADPQLPSGDFTIEAFVVLRAR